MHRGRDGGRLHPEAEFAADPTPHSRRKWLAVLAKHPYWEPRKGDTGRYNCAGMVWASRRTSIFTNFDEILRDDGYRQLPRDEPPLVGDLAIYADGADHAHVGMIVRLDAGLAPGSPEIAVVLSKWDSASGEYLHRVYDHPFGAVDVQYWTDRPTKETP